jgi:hypothetical protein
LLTCFAFGLMGLTLVAANGPFVEPDVTVIHALDGEQVGDGYGWVAENLGDINGDGVNDFITSAPFYVENGLVIGRAYVYSGADGALLNVVSGVGNDLLGYGATRAGDVNADGVPDYIVGASLGGYAQVYSGADHSLLLDLHGAGSDRFGFSVGAAGDVNGDGYGDVQVGAIFAGGTGQLSVFSGQDGSLIWSRSGLAAGDNLGTAVGLVGDVNSDGIPDQVAGAAGAGPASGGRAYVFSGIDGTIIHTLYPFAPGTAVNFGLYFANGAGDINNDGTPDIFVADYNNKRGGGAGTGSAAIYSGVDGSLMYQFNADNKADGFGPGRGTGDVNGDGYGDVIIAAYTANDGAPGAGKATLYSGADGSVLRTMTGNVENDALGVDALSVGDVNGDGLADYVLTAVGLSFSGLDVGHLYIVAGNP